MCGEGVSLFHSTFMNAYTMMMMHMYTVCNCSVVVAAVSYMYMM